MYMLFQSPNIVQFYGAVLNGENLLVFESKDGWEPLCKFLEVPVPNEPYPRVNDTQEFNNRRKFIMKPKLIQ